VLPPEEGLGLVVDRPHPLKQAPLQRYNRKSDRVEMQEISLESFK